jgi:DNA topoisomerase-1
MAVAERTRPARTQRLRRSNPSGPGYARRRCGKGFMYLDEEGVRLTDPEIVARITALVIPPAWRDVWISPDPFGHIQATGFDEAGRKQYLYHPRWRERRDLQKFDDMVRFARALPALREVVAHDLALGDVSREQILACAARLLDRGFFRIGSEVYAVTNETYGLATMLKSHATVDGDTIRFDYVAKESKRRVQAVIDPEVAELVGTLKRRRGGGDELLAYKRGGRWCDVRSPDINAYLKAATGLDISAKDFRTWGATVLAEVGLAVTEPARLTKTARKRAIVRAVKEVAFYLGNTPAVARNSYIDPRVFDRYRDGETINGKLDMLAAEPGATAIQGPVEEAVLELLS